MRNDLGLNMSVAFNVFAKAVVREQGIPFEVSLKKDTFQNEANMERLTQSLASLKSENLID
ncbi:MAG: type II toxin-antitoxin system RelB/DinJ family antitoxin [Bacillota bacterium]|nr:type II toxin-antitoxin system RelB/DinJ family antitoxin [Bacillota bacterium]